MKKSLLLAVLLSSVTVSTGWAGEVLPPSLDLKTTLPTTLLPTQKTIDCTNTKEIVKLTDFNPSGDYTIEIKARINSASDCRGLDIETRDNLNHGFRTSVSTNSLDWASPISALESVSSENNSNAFHIFRFAVTGNDIHIYRDQSFITTKKQSTATYINDTDQEITSRPSVNSYPSVVNEANLIANPQFDNSVIDQFPEGWLTDAQTTGGSPNPRVQVSQVPDGLSGSKNQAFMFRCDDKGGKYFSYKVTLKPNTWYQFSCDLLPWGVGGSAKAVDFIVSNEETGLTGIISKTAETTSYVASNSEKASKKVTIYFKTPENEITQYYLCLRGVSATYGITNLQLLPGTLDASLVIGKNQISGSANMVIESVTYDESGAYAPKEIIIEAPKLTLKRVLAEKLIEDETSIETTAAKEVLTFDKFNPTGDYTLEIEAKVTATNARGLDIETSNHQEKGFRASLNTTDLSWATPVSSISPVIAIDNKTPHLYRFAVSSNLVHIYKDNLFVTSKTLAEATVINDNNEEVLIKPTFPAHASVVNNDNLIKNPQFNDNALNEAPTGWLSDKAMGSGSNPRVQSSQVPTGLSGSKNQAFMFRFDYLATYFSYAVTLVPNTWYEFKADFIGWGTNGANKNVDFVIASNIKGTENVLVKSTETAPATRNDYKESKPVSFKFKTPDNSTTTYYVCFNNGSTTSSVSYAVTNLQLISGKSCSLVIGNQVISDSQMKIQKLSYDQSGAYAPDPIISGAEKTENTGMILSTEKEQINILHIENGTHVQIYDISGKLLDNIYIQGNAHSQYMQPGIYIVKAIYKNQVQTQKVIIR